ncbi:GntR family transcriptional regulator [Mesorhizobium amorphae]|uniref:GntR family transcriptional regulator n=1 Tax=Mesorhizobium amorphae TaxID=71433 RepID=UPI0005917F34|nr:GntR family transcriptional regulator [Mesorhizobium amorphae]ANT54627.1 hypothetical protein A6B35_32030 [Mesorhizobium amorphae CCNWGS0123]
MERNVLSDSVPISTRQISTILGVSPVPVREALFRVSHEGLMDFVPEKGFYAKTCRVSQSTTSCRLAASHPSMLQAGSLTACFFFLCYGLGAAS